jgi:hypothetical protein
LCMHKPALHLHFWPFGPKRQGWETSDPLLIWYIAVLIHGFSAFAMSQSIWCSILRANNWYLL